MQPDPVTISLEPLRRPGGVKELVVALQDAREQPVRLDASDLTEMMPTLGVQALICAEHDWQLRDISFEVVNIQPNCREALALLGVQENHFNSGDGS